MEASSSLNMPSFQPAFIKVVRWRGRLRRAETTQQPFFKGESLNISHWNIEEMRPLMTTETSSGTLMNVMLEHMPCLSTKLWFQDLSGGLISKKKIADDGNTSQIDGFSMIYVPWVLYISGGLPDAVKWGGMEFVVSSQRSSPKQFPAGNLHLPKNPSGMDTAKWDALHLPPARPHVMRRKKSHRKGMVGFLLSLFQEAKAPSVVWQNHHSPFAESSCVTLCYFKNDVFGTGILSKLADMSEMLGVWWTMDHPSHSPPFEPRNSEVALNKIAIRTQIEKARNFKRIPRLQWHRDTWHASPKKDRAKDRKIGYHHKSNKVPKNIKGCNQAFWASSSPSLFCSFGCWSESPHWWTWEY